MVVLLMMVRFQKLYSIHSIIIICYKVIEKLCHLMDCNGLCLFIGFVDGHSELFKRCALFVSLKC